MFILKSFSYRLAPAYSAPVKSSWHPPPSLAICRRNEIRSQIPMEPDTLCPDDVRSATENIAFETVAATSWWRGFCYASCSWNND
jgi:hypothetical protein